MYGAGGAVLIVLIGLLVLFLRGGGGTGRQQLDDEWNKTDAFSEQMLNMNSQISTSTTAPDAPDLDAPILVSPPEPDTQIPIYDFGQSIIEDAAIEQPSTSLMGMMDANGREHIEYPMNSGRLWYRDNPDSDWIKN